MTVLNISSYEAHFLSASPMSMVVIDWLWLMQVDVEAVDFGLVAFGFRYAKEFTLYNTCAIPMHYSWRIPKDSLDPAHKEFTVRNTDLTTDTKFHR